MGVIYQTIIQLLFKTINMKKILFVAALFAGSLSMNAQDILVRKGGDVENVKVLEITPTEVKFKKFNNQNGPTFTERRSNLISVKFENGEVQKFNDAPGSLLTATGEGMAYYSGYGKDKRFTNEVSLYIANVWGVGYQLRREFNPYIAWNIVGVSYISNFDDPSEMFTLNIRALGARGYTPSWKWIRGYADLNLGLGVNYYHYDWDFNFGLDFGVGVNVHKKIAIGYNLNYVASGGTGHMAKISFLF